MPGTLQEYAAAVDNVIAICRDAEQGFRAAADAVKDPLLKELFDEFAAQRATFASELQTAVKVMGFEPTHPSGVGGLVHGVWMTVKGAFTGKSAHAILIEAERGEDWSLKTYREALTVSLPVELRSIVERQYEQIVQAHNRIRSLRDASERANPPETPTPAAPTR